MKIQLLLISYCILVVAASLGGGAIPWLMRFTHRQMQLLMSFVGGLMLGVAVLHLWPHGVRELELIPVVLRPLDLAAAWVLAGLLSMFLLIRVFHVHAHEHGDISDVSHGPSHAHGCEHDHDHHHHHDSGLLHLGKQGLQDVDTAHRFSWFGLAIGLSVHTLIDGLALGAAVASEGKHEQGWLLAGLGTFLAVALHKPLDALSITSLMAAGGWTKRQAWLANIGFALMCPIGAFAFAFGIGGLGNQSLFIGCALAFSAGVFLCISLADLLPELAFHAHDRLPLTLVLGVGVALAWLIGYLEPPHAHVHPPSPRGPGDTSLITEPEVRQRLAFARGLSA
jgi:zinc and cadmium transporter